MFKVYNNVHREIIRLIKIISNFIFSDLNKISFIVFTFITL